MQFESQTWVSVPPKLHQVQVLCAHAVCVPYMTDPDPNPNERLLRRVNAVCFGSQCSSALKKENLIWQCFIFPKIFWLSTILHEFSKRIKLIKHNVVSQKVEGYQK